MFQCRLCALTFESIQDHCRHVELVHSVTSNPSITCGFASCSARVRGSQRYMEHFSNFHESKSGDNEGLQLKCAYANCNYTAKSRSTLRGHFFWKHSSDVPTESSVDQASTSHNFEIQEGPSLDEVEMRCMPLTEPLKKSQHDEYSEEVLVKKMVHLNLTANSKYHVPDSTLGFMLDGYRRLLHESAKISEKILKTELEVLGHDEKVSQAIVDKVLFEPGLLKLHGVDGPLRSRYMREKQYQKFFPYVPPVSHNLGLNDKNIKCKYHTVSLKQSLQAFFEDDSVYEQYCERKSLLTPSDDLSDICHGSIFQNHELFSKDPSAIQIIAYQDEIEMADALGPSGGMYKLLHMAYTVGNLFPWNRSKVDPIQLMLLCKEKDVAYFGLPRVLQPVLEELKELEETGVEIRGQLIKGSILVLEGDNLGTHTVGGFTAGFANSEYFCRYCTESRKEWHSRWFPTVESNAQEYDDSESDSSSSSSDSSDDNEDCPVSTSCEDNSSSDDDIPLSVLKEKGLENCKMRTKESYDECVEQLSENTPSGILGVVANCVFNDLKYFHIVKGSPPCVAHDILEGVVAFDLMLCIKKLMKGKFSYDYLNRKLKSFPFQDTDVLDRPPSKFHSERKKVKGSAVQNWVFLRFLPLLIGERIVDKGQNQVMKMVLLLIKIVSLIMSPVISRRSLSKTHKLIHEYLHLRATIFPNVRLRPKHHFFEHYCKLTEMYGPLSKCSTLRFESKHKFFRAEIRAKKNMKNITKTISKGHQRFQSSLKVGEMFARCPIVESPISFEMLEVSEDVKTLLLTSFGKEYVQTLFFAEELTYHNTKYKAGRIIVTSTCTYPEIQCCRISIMVSDGKSAYAVGKECVGKLDEQMQIFEISEQSTTSMFALDTLKDYVPYPMYSFREKDVIVLKHLYLQ